MPVSNISKLGNVINGIASEQDSIKENLSPDDSETQEQLVMFEKFIITGDVTLNKLEYADDSFVIDHPVYGDIDSTTLLIDGGWLTGGAGWPTTWGTWGSTGTVIKTQLYKKSF